jgi:transmembrane protein 222
MRQPPQLPGITWLFPFIGHLGIGDSRGVIYDFAGPYYIGIDNLAFSRPIRYLQLDPSKARLREGVSPQKAWDAAVDTGCDVYCTRMHNIW